MDILAMACVKVEFNEKSVVIMELFGDVSYGEAFKINIKF